MVLLWQTIGNNKRKWDELIQAGGVKLDTSTGAFVAAEVISGDWNGKLIRFTACKSQKNSLVTTLLNKGSILSSPLAPSVQRLVISVQGWTRRHYDELTSLKASRTVSHNQREQREADKDKWELQHRLVNEGKTEKTAVHHKLKVGERPSDEKENIFMIGLKRGVDVQARLRYPSLRNASRSKKQTETDTAVIPYTAARISHNATFISCHVSHQSRSEHVGALWTSFLDYNNQAGKMPPACCLMLRVCVF